jgi:hypothetical protein
MNRSSSTGLNSGADPPLGKAGPGDTYGGSISTDGEKGDEGVPYSMSEEYAERTASLTLSGK